MPVSVDEVDPRLMDALDNPRDRPFVLKLEKDVIVFVTGTYVSTTSYFTLHLLT